MASLEKIVCPICSARSVFALSKNGFDLYRCPACRLLFVFPLPPETAHIYESDYFSGAREGFGYVDYDQDKTVMKKIFLKYLDHLKDILGNRGLMLDVGAATGYFLNLARQAGWSVGGIEISDYAANIARQRGFNVETGVITDVKKGRQFDAVTMWDVIEHVRDPLADLRKIHELLKLGGVLAINTPNSDSLTAKILGSHWHLLVPPEHLYYFNLTSLRKALETIGFRLVTVKYPGKVFTLEYIFHILAHWQKFSLWKKILEMLEKHPKIGHLGVPINLWDNILIYAVKV